jgi:ubiquinone/menaquinone biosynthesis C-methylase UbiE
VLLQALGISLLVWIPPTLLVYLSAASLGIEFSPLVGMNMYSLATLLGGITLAPAGFGATGSILILLLEQSQVNISNSILAVTLVRTMSMAVVLVLGSVFLFRQWKPVSQVVSGDLHFDQIANDYRAQFSDHVWQHLFQKKDQKLRQALLEAGIRQGIGLDLGCGLGLQCQALSKESYSIYGIDMAFNLLRHARQLGVPAVQADALQLPYPDHSLDFVYTIGVLHHLPGADLQSRVADEVSRILKPGGLFIIHETNPHNPLFRFYMGYLFPILRSIDEGTEYWIKPETWKGLQSLHFVDLQYFTFIPDFLPQTITARLLGLEKRLESSRFRPFSVHYMAVLQKGG